jgi:hypothetical protein
VPFVIGRCCHWLGTVVSAWQLLFHPPWGCCIALTTDDRPLR